MLEKWGGDDCFSFYLCSWLSSGIKDILLTKIDWLWFARQLNQYFLIFSLQKKLQDVSMKFRLFQKPANFEQRLQESKMILDEVKMHLPALETKSVEQEVVQSQLNHCVVCISGDIHSYSLTFLIKMYLMISFIIEFFPVNYKNM